MTKRKSNKQLFSSRRKKIIVEEEESTVPVGVPMEIQNDPLLELGKDVIDLTSVEEKKEETKKEQVKVSKKVKETNETQELKTTSEWVSASSLHNCMIGEHLIDWLDLYGNLNQGEKYDAFTLSLFEKGHQFEKKIVDILRGKFPVHFVSDQCTAQSFQLTREALAEGHPILHSVPLIHWGSRTCGVADLLVRSDILEKLFKNPPSVNSHHSAFGAYHYVVLDVKFTTMGLNADGVHIGNSNHFPAYKAQTFLYNRALGELQKYTPKDAYILGKGFRYVSKGETYRERDPFNRLGVFTFDKAFEEKVNQNVEWLRELRKNGKFWSVHDHRELRPVYRVNGAYSNEIQRLIRIQADITQIYNCGKTDRDKALDKGVESWKDPRFNTELIGRSTHKVAPNIENILRVNREEKTVILPERLTAASRQAIQPQPREFCVDFETTTTDEDAPPLIFMISIFWVDEKGTTHTANERVMDLTDKDEKNLLMWFLNHVNGPANYVYHWSHAERTLLNSACDKHQIVSNVNWVDLHEIVKREYFAVKGAFGYGLKEIYSALLNHRLVPEINKVKDVVNGLDAMVMAYNAYQETPQNYQLLNRIAEYNNIDVQMVYHILCYLRSK
jgi:uncharacterized protein YprB with RNaseH-like and TPR domain